MGPHGKVNLHVRFKVQSPMAKYTFKWAKLIFRLINAILDLF